MSSLTISKISVDTTNIADGSSIASYLVDAAGALLTSTLVGGTQQSLDVNVTQSALPSGAATEATSASILDELQALSNVDGAAWGAGATGIEALAIRHDATGPLTGVADGDFSPLQVDANGLLKVNASVTFTAEHDEDSPATSGDSGVFTLLVRQDTLATSTSADGDYGAFKSNSLGELYVHDTSVLAQLVTANSTLTNIKSDTASIVTNTANTATNTGNIHTDLTTLTKLEDAAASSGDAGIQTLLVRQDTLSTSTSADGDYGSFKSNASGELYVVDSTVRSLITALSKSEDAAHASGDQGIQALAVRKDAQGTNTSADGDYSSLQTWSEGSLKVVDVANSTILQQQVSVTNVATALPTSALANRKSLMIQNTGANKLWVGSATVTTSGATAGIEFASNSFMELEVGPAVSVFAIKVGATANTVNVLEIS